MRVVLDTNVLIRALMSPAGTWGQVVARRRDYVHVTSPDLIRELLRVVRQRRLTKRFGGVEGQRRAVEAALELVGRAEVVEAPDFPGICRDPDDDKFFACALAGNADYIVSEDEDILAISEYEGVRTIRAAEFIRLLDS